jgi:hypothetical protein
MSAKLFIHPIRLNNKNIPIGQRVQLLGEGNRKRARQRKKKPDRCQVILLKIELFDKFSITIEKTY